VLRAMSDASVVSPPVRLPACALPAALLAGLLPGCAGDDDSSRFPGEAGRVAEAATRLGSAARAGDAAQICTASLAASVVKRLGASQCPARVAAALRDVSDGRFEVVAVRLRGDAAIATVKVGGDPPRSGNLALVREGGIWRVARVGPLPPLGR
jgi:hypothetical protein